MRVARVKVFSWSAPFAFFGGRLLARLAEGNS